VAAFSVSPTLRLADEKIDSTIVRGVFEHAVMPDSAHARTKYQNLITILRSERFSAARA